jgi:hypothetical protein
VKTYHFSCGNSTRGPIGLCAQVVAQTRREALRKLRSTLEKSLGSYSEISVRAGRRSFEYINVYISPENIRLAHVDEIDAPE